MTPNMSNPAPYVNLNHYHHHSIMRLPSINQLSPNTSATQFYNQKISKATSNETKAQQNSNTNVKRKRSWSRAVFSNLQRKGLERQFEFQKYITKPDRKKLAARLGLKDAQVKVWFQVNLNFSVCESFLQLLFTSTESPYEMASHNARDNDSQQSHKLERKRWPEWRRRALHIK